MSEHPIISRVARAMATAAANVIEADSEGRRDWVEANWRDFHPDARDAIEAMRNPTDDMIQASRPWLLQYHQMRVGDKAMARADAFTAMIDAVLQIQPDSKGGA